MYKPTSGKVQITGRVAALIELGAGFHPELTGRENIVLNSLLLGLSKREIRGRVEQILDFAELGTFIDSPIKQYSSGMYMRLGFAIATAVDPDILLIDEILGVGDASFQNKCAARIDDFRMRGKTIVFVSHNAGTVLSICRRAVWIQGGKIAEDGPAEQVVAHYEESAQHPVGT